MHVNEVAVKENQKSQRFIGKQVTVNVNPDTGVVITSWKTGTRIKARYEREHRK